MAYPASTFNINTDDATTNVMGSASTLNLLLNEDGIRSVTNAFESCEVRHLDVTFFSTQFSSLSLLL